MTNEQIERLTKYVYSSKHHVYWTTLRVHRMDAKEIQTSEGPIELNRLMIEDFTVWILVRVIDWKNNDPQTEYIK